MKFLGFDNSKKAKKKQLISNPTLDIWSSGIKMQNTPLLSMSDLQRLPIPVKESDEDRFVFSMPYNYLNKKSMLERINKNDKVFQRAAEYVEAERKQQEAQEVSWIVEHLGKTREEAQALWNKKNRMGNLLKNS